MKPVVNLERWRIALIVKLGNLDWRWNKTWSDYKRSVWNINAIVENETFPSFKWRCTISFKAWLKTWTKNGIVRDSSHPSQWDPSKMLIHNWNRWSLVFYSLLLLKLLQFTPQWPRQWWKTQWCDMNDADLTPSLAPGLIRVVQLEILRASFAPCLSLSLFFWPFAIPAARLI